MQTFQVTAHCLKGSQATHSLSLSFPLEAHSVQDAEDRACQWLEAEGYSVLSVAVDPQ